MSFVQSAQQTSVLYCRLTNFMPKTTDTQWRHKSKISEKLGRCGRQNMLRPYLEICDWDWILGCALKALSSLGVRSPWIYRFTTANQLLALFAARMTETEMITEIMSEGCLRDCLRGVWGVSEWSLIAVKYQRFLDNFKLFKTCIHSPKKWNMFLKTWFWSFTSLRWWKHRYSTISTYSSKN